MIEVAICIQLGFVVTMLCLIANKLDAILFELRRTQE